MTLGNLINSTSVFSSSITNSESVLPTTYISPTSGNWIVPPLFTTTSVSRSLWPITSTCRRSPFAIVCLYDPSTVALSAQKAGRINTRNKENDIINLDKGFKTMLFLKNFISEYYPYSRQVIIGEICVISEIAKFGIHMISCAYINLFRKFIIYGASKSYDMAQLVRVFI